MSLRAEDSFDYLVIGAGIIGLSIARDLRNRYPSAEIAILEKEADVAYHSSGRNSGVLHAGFYYTADSLKARFTRDGNKYRSADYTTAVNKLDLDIETGVGSVDVH